MEYNIVLLFETVGAQACEVFVMYFHKPVTFCFTRGRSGIALPRLVMEKWEMV
jgi:hypothetical protein